VNLYHSENLLLSFTLVLNIGLFWQNDILIQIKGWRASVFSTPVPYFQNRNESSCLPGVFGELIQAQLLEHEPHNGIKYPINSADNINVIPIRSYTTPTLVQ